MLDLRHRRQVATERSNLIRDVLRHTFVPTATCVWISGGTDFRPFCVFKFSTARQRQKIHTGASKFDAEVCGVLNRGALLDFTGDAATMGKPAASDLREGKATLAVLDLMSSGPVEATDLARSAIDDGDSDAIARLTGLLHEHGAIERSRRRARLFAESAVGQLDAFERGPAYEALVGMPELLLSRDR